MRKFLTLDGLRGIAALSIVVLHCYRYFGDLTWSSAALAVDLFFVLSGFVLAYAYEAVLPTGSWAFMKARLVRLYPLYLVGTLLGVIEAIGAIKFGVGSVAWSWSKFWLSLPFSILMLPAPADMYPFDGVMWSIFLELFINATWALFWRPLQSTRVLIAVIVIAGAGLSLSCVYWQTYVALGTSWGTLVGGVFRVAYSFFLGVLLFRIHPRWVLPRLSPLVLFIGLPMVLFIRLPPYAQLMLALFVLPWFVLLGARVEPEGILDGLARQVGIASYAIYAVHKRFYALSYGFVLIFLHIDLQRLVPLSGIIFVLLLVPCCLLLSRWIDQPARRWLGKRFRTQGRALRKAGA